MRGREPLDLLDRDLVVAPHDHLHTELAEQVRQVVRERVVVVDQEQHQGRCLRRVDRALDRRELVQALLVLGRRVGVGDEPAAGLQVGDPVVQEHRPQRDAGVEPDAGDVVADHAGVEAAPVALELGDDLHRPHLGRARHGPGRERRPQQVPGADAVGDLAGDLGDEVRDVREPLDLEEALDVHRARRQTRERSLRPRSTSITCSARSFSEASSRSASPSPAAGRPGDRVQARARALELHVRLRRRADHRVVAELEQEQVRRRVDPAQRAVDRERRGGRRAARPAARARSGTRRRRGCAPCSGERAASCVAWSGKRTSGPAAAPVEAAGTSAGASSSARITSGSPRSTSETPPTWSKRSSVSATTNRLTGRPGPASGSGTVGSSSAIQS